MSNVFISSKKGPFPCYKCNRVKETRPYGPRGKEICFECMKSNPILEKNAEEIFGKILDGL